MAYVPVPKDLTRVKSKLVFNLTKRQIICFSLGALAGVPLFFLTKGAVGTSVAALLMIKTEVYVSLWQSLTGALHREKKTKPKRSKRETESDSLEVAA